MKKKTRTAISRGSSHRVLDLSFFVGVALGTIVTAFCAVGSYRRGFDSVRRASWSREHAARKRALSKSS
jgi:hypothetical protein